MNLCGHLTDIQIFLIGDGSGWRRQSIRSSITQSLLAKLKISNCLGCSQENCGAYGRSPSAFISARICASVMTGFRGSASTS
jgi:hypothetical protein